jgi:hypothetical protein
LKFILISKDILFLGLLTLNVMECAPGKFDVAWFEIVLWIWIFASAFEEGVQYSQDRGLYTGGNLAEHTRNKSDLSSF